MATEFNDRLLRWEAALVTAIQGGLAHVGAVVPSISPVRVKNITAKDQTLRRNIKEL